MLDPLQTSTAIDEEFIGYLSSTFGPRRSDLRSEYQRALTDGAQLSRGPFVQASAPFEAGRSVTELVKAGHLSSHFSDLATSFPLDRPLHLHQDQAIMQSVERNRNLVVSTGTGSGKTETFLLPIIDHLLRERDAGTLETPGVRALLLYPMNALANDQVKRLRELLAPVPDITFGRYTGETKGSQREAEDDFRQRYPGAALRVNELISREEMQLRPPHLLLTNYAMLEYLLLRPADTTLFDGGYAKSWRFVVLDEAHVYNGAQGTEVAYLLRRLRDRVTSSEPGRLRCFATSATLGAGVSDNPEIVQFAEDLFGEPFEWVEGDADRSDVISATRRPLTFAESETHRLSPEEIRDLHRCFRSGATPEDLVAAAPSATNCEASSEVPSTLHSLLRGDGNVRAVQIELSENSAEVRDLASAVFPDERDRDRLAVQLIDLCVNARLSSEDAPLLPARYHHFLRSLEGAFVCLHPDHAGDTSRISLVRHDECQGCRAQRRTSMLFELATCRHCRAEYVVGVPTPIGGDYEQLRRSNDFDPGRRYFLLGAAVDADDEDEQATNIAAESVESDLELCASCGCVVAAGSSCGCGTTSATRTAVARVEPAKNNRGSVQRCASCSGRSSGEVLFRFLTGTDAPVSVVATSLYQHLPRSTDEMAVDQVGEGRKLLAFSDSRQDAAFFAGFLERTYGRSLHRALILRSITESSAPLRTDDVIDAVLKLAEDYLVLEPDDGRAKNRRVVASWLLEELLAIDRRQSLEGTGLIRIGLGTPRKYRTPPALVQLGLSEPEADDLVQLLLGTLRSGGALTTPEGVDIRDEQFAPRNREFAVRGQGSDYGVLGWQPADSSSNRRLDIIQKLFERLGVEADPIELIQSLWRYVSDPGGPWRSTLIESSSRNQGAVWKLDIDRFEFTAISNDRRPSRCDRCFQLTWWNVASICPAWRCGGTVQSIEDVSTVTEEHYAKLYQRLQPIALTAQEHTAQWSAREASAVQDKFINGDINVLSCSTTFEMGVDVGDLQAVLLRNVPPAVANYVQRAGRAGRRTDSAALVVTYAQRRNHDRFYFDHPRKMIDGHVPTPSILLDNVHIARRHTHSVAFARYLRVRADSGESVPSTVGEFFVPADEESVRPSDHFERWLRDDPAEVQAALRRLLPSGVARELDVEQWAWARALFEESDESPTEGWFERAQAEVRNDLQRLDELKADALDIEDARALGRYQHLERTIRSKQLFSHLASRNVLPKYGFPVDVIDLSVAGSGHRLAGKIELSRDLKLAISDYAPGSQVVAGKVLWASTGLAVRPDHAWPTYGWAVCNQCGAFRRALAERPANCHICGAGEVKAGAVGRFVVPIYGFVGKDVSTSGETRPLRSAYAEPFFSSDEDLPFEVVDGLSGAGARARISRQGRIAMINRAQGAGYRVCEWCGAGEPAPMGGGRTKTKGHKDQRRPGRECSGPLLNVHLGHEYLTDVVELKLDTLFDHNTATSILYALVESSRELGINREELDGTLFVYAEDYSPGLVLFDAVPGGAGHCQRIARRLPELLGHAHRRVDNCTCGRDSSCYSCIRSYANQRMHESLNRGRAADALAEVLGLDAGST